MWAKAQTSFQESQRIKIRNSTWRSRRVTTESPAAYATGVIVLIRGLCLRTRRKKSRRLISSTISVELDSCEVHDQSDL